jgi:hypothetical protein
MPERTAQLNQPVTKDDLKDLSNPEYTISMFG